MIFPDGPWRLMCSEEQFVELRHDKEFAFLITAARMINALRFGIAAVTGTARRPDPGSERVRACAFQYMCGLMHELLEFRDKHGKNWEGLTAYQAIFSVLDESRLSP